MTEETRRHYLLRAVERAYHRIVRATLKRETGAKKRGSAGRGKC